MATERVTVTLPAEILQDIDRMETNRSRFVLDPADPLGTGFLLR